MSDKEITYEDRSDFYYALIGWGSLDVGAAIQMLKKFDIDFNDFAYWLEDWLKDVDIQLFDCDICAATYEFILQEAKSKLRDYYEHVDAINKKLEEAIDEIYVYGNYMCSMYDNKTKLEEFMTANDEWRGNSFLEQFYEEIWD